MVNITTLKRKSLPGKLNLAKAYPIRAFDKTTPTTFKTTRNNVFKIGRHKGNVG